MYLVMDPSRTIAAAGAEVLTSCRDASITLNDLMKLFGFQDIALMDEQEREDFIKKIGISADDSDETDDDEEEDDPEHHKYNCKKCQVSLILTRKTNGRLRFVVYVSSATCCKSGLWLLSWPRPDDAFRYR